MIESPIDYGVGYFVSFFEGFSAPAIGLAIALGAVWLACYWPPLFKKPWLWAVLVGSAFLTAAVVYFIQNPLDRSILQTFYFWLLSSHRVLARLIIVMVIPLLKGLVQEGAKLVPVVVWWRRSDKNINPKLGLIIGAVAGAGFGIFQAWSVLAPLGALPFRAIDFFYFWALYRFWHIFFIVAAQIAFSALAGYGLARGWGWQFYLIASALHGLLEYGVVSGLFFIYRPAAWGYPAYSREVPIYTAVLAVLVTAWALWLRWRKRSATADTTTSSP